MAKWVVILHHFNNDIKWLRDRFTLSPILQLSIAMISIVVVYHWFGGFYIRYFLDDYFPFNPVVDFHYLLYSWQSLPNGGSYLPFVSMSAPYTLIVLIANWFGITPVIADITITALLFLSSGIGTFRLTRLFSSKNDISSLLSSFFASLLYMFNPISMVIFYSNGWPISNMFLAFLPWFIYYLIIGIRKSSVGGFPFSVAALVILLSIPVVGANEPADFSSLILIAVFASLELLKIVVGYHCDR